ncbi:MAG: hypothetical protein KTR31_30980, partial [Myxococcales bacterium]|nr:hypothetical protein [Myxococcales bacterium]
AAVSATVAALRIPDLTPLQKRLDAMQGELEAIPRTFPEIPQPHKVDLRPLDKRLGAIEAQLQADSGPDLEPLTTGLATVSATVAALRIPDLTPVQERLDAVEGQLETIPRTFPEFPQPHKVDLRPLDKRLGAIEAQLQSDSGPDLTPVQERLDAVEKELKGIPRTFPNIPQPHKVDLQPISTRLAAVSSSVAAIRIPSLDPVKTRLSAIEQKLAAMEARNGSAQPDFSGLEARLSSIQTLIKETADTRPIDEGLRRSSGRNLLTRPAFGPKDDLKEISGVGPVLERLLNDVGVYYFWQVAEWTASDIAFVDDRLDAFQGRIERDAWVPQASKLATTSKAPSHRDNQLR